MPVKITAVEFSRDGSKLMSCAYAPEAKAAHMVVWSVAGGIGTVYSNLEIETGSMPLSTGAPAACGPRCHAAPALFAGQLSIRSLPSDCPPPRLRRSVPGTDARQLRRRQLL